MKRLVVIGQGYVGLPMSIHAASAGMEVRGLDTNESTVATLNSGSSHIGDVSDSELQVALRNGFAATTDPSVIAQADVVLVCVPTPLSADGGPDLAAVEMAAKTVGEHVTSGTLVVLESTTYPGTTGEVFAPLVAVSGLEIGTEIFVAFSPERIDPGNTSYGVKNTPKVVGGLTKACTQSAVKFYSAFVDTVVPAKGAMEAEMSKLLENTFRHVNIALVNEMVRFSDELGVDLWNAISCAESKPFGFMAFRPGPGVGGHCIPIDPSYLSHRVKATLGYSFRMVELAEEINTAAPLYVATRLWQLLNDREVTVKGANILLVGVTYKADVADCRETPASPLARRLASWGANVSYHDPYVPSWTVNLSAGPTTFRCAEDLYATARSADAVVLLQNHSAYDLDLLTENSSFAFDTRNVLPDRPNVIRL